MVNLTVSLANQPADLTWWQFAIYEIPELRPHRRSVGSGMLGPNQPAQLVLPADWGFPSQIWLPSSALLIQSIGPEFGGHFDPNILVPNFGDHIFDWTIRNFHGVQPPIVQPPNGEAPPDGQPIPGMEGMMDLFMMVIMMELMAGMMEGLAV